jgi:uncharacterized protein YjeT (DUF2065 family)
MRKSTSLERALLTIAAALVVGGCWMFAFPHQFVAQIQSTSKGGGPRTFIQSFSKSDCRLFGGLAIVVGISVGWLAFYPSKR